MTGNGARWSRTALGAAEVMTPLVVAAGFILSCTTIHTDPLDRVGQVSGLASLVLRFSVAALAVTAALVAAHHWRGGRWFVPATRFGCATIAGLLGGMLAGGVLVALQRTPYGIAGNTGDIRVLTDWAMAVMEGHQPAVGVYPPLQLEMIVTAAESLGAHPLYVVKPLQIAGIALVPPLAYLAWRLILSPRWALGIGVTAALPLYDAYRPFPLLALIVFIPLVIRFIGELRGSADVHPIVLARRGLALGVAFGVLFLLYSGWFQWSAPGVAIAAAIVYPWRRWKHGLVLCVASGCAFALIAARYLASILAAPPILDDFFYFDTRTDPAYIAMWRGDLPGPLETPGLWPPLGELGGVGLFSILLVVGFGLAIAVGRRRTPVLVIVALVIGAWLFRFWHAHRMWDTGLVQLYPRTTAEILYGLLLLSGLGVMYVTARLRRHVDARAVTLGAIPALSLLYAFAGSALADRYMPRDLARDPGQLSWFAHHTLRVDGNQTIGATVEVSSALTTDGARPHHLVDGDPATTFSSALQQAADHEEWVELRLPTPRPFAKVVLHPAADGFPVAFTVDVWDGKHWIPRVTYREASPPVGPLELSFGRRDFTDRVRLHATELGRAGEHRALRLAEIELRQ